MDVLIAGDTLDFLTTVSAYPPADGWTLKFRLVPRSASTGPAIVFPDATTSGTDYRVQVGPSTTAGWAAGDYAWSSRVEKTGARHVVSGWVIDGRTYHNGDEAVIKPDPAVIAAYDNRSHARKALAAVEAAIEALSLGVKEYSIAGRSMTHRDLPELLEMRDRYRVEVSREDAASAAANGRPNPRRYYLRFGRA